MAAPGGFACSGGISPLEHLFLQSRPWPARVCVCVCLDGVSIVCVSVVCVVLSMCGVYNIVHVCVYSVYSICVCLYVVCVMSVICVMCV